MGNRPERNVQCVDQYSSLAVRCPSNAAAGVGLVSVWQTQSSSQGTKSGRDVDLHVALDRRCAVHLNIRPLKIRPGLEIHETRMQHLDPAAVSGAKFAAVNALILPDLLQEMLRRRGVPLSQDGRHRLLAPL